MDLLSQLPRALLSTLWDLLPISAVLLAFHVVARRRPPRLTGILYGLLMLIAGMTLLRVGLEASVLRIGALMARQLTDPSLVDAAGAPGDLGRYRWALLFAAAIGLSAALVEPTLTAVAERAGDLSGGAIQPLSLRVTVAIGVAAGMLLGVLRIVAGVPLAPILVVLVALSVLLSRLAPRSVLGLAFDTGGLATSVVTVPLAAALGVGVAAAIPGRSALADGFGLIVMALLVPSISVMTFAWLQALLARSPPAGDDDAVQADPRARR